MKPESQNEEDLKDLAPFLSEMRKENHFPVPGGYFEMLPSMIQERCVEATRNPGITLWKLLLGQIREVFSGPAPALAFIALIVVFLVVVPRFQLQTEEPNPMAYSISAEDLNTANVLNTIDEETLIEALPEQNPASIQDTDPDADIQDYLINNHVDVSQITNEL